MGVIKRFSSIMSCNVNSLKNKFIKAEDPILEINKYLREMESELGKTKAEASAVFDAERRAKRDLNEVEEEMLKLERYIQKSLENGNSSDSRIFSQKKEDLSPRYNTLKQSYDYAAENSKKIAQINDKLTSDMTQLMAEQNELKAKIQSTQTLNDGPMGEKLSKLNKLAQDSERSMYEAQALEELNKLSDSKNDDSQFDCLYKDDEA